jgi:hypothetical protein
LRSLASIINLGQSIFLASRIGPFRLSLVTFQAYTPSDRMYVE